MMEGLTQSSILFKRRGLFYHDLVHIIAMDGFISLWMRFILSWHSIHHRSDSLDHSNKHVEWNHFFKIIIIILIKLILRGSVKWALVSIKEKTHLITIYCMQLKGFTLLWIGFILSWYSICYRSDSFYHSKKPVEWNHFFFIILIKIIMRGSV